MVLKQIKIILIIKNEHGMKLTMVMLTMLNQMLLLKILIKLKTHFEVS